MAQNIIINIGGVNKNSVPYINIGNGVWKVATLWLNIGNNTWKQCYSSIQIMTVYIPSSGDSSSQSQSKTISITGLQSVVDCTVNTGSVSYTISGTNVIIDVSGGSAVRSETPSTTGTDTRSTSAGGNPNTLPTYVYYDSGGYSGYIYAHYAAVVTSGTPAGTKTCTGTWGANFVVVNGNQTEGPTDIPSTISYSDGDGYSGNLNYVDISPSYQSNFDAYINAFNTNTSWSGYLQWDYSADLTKTDTRVWTQTYSDLVYGSTTYYYAYVVTLNYIA